MLARPAFRVVYTIAGRRVSIEAQDDWSAQAVSSLLSGWFLKPVSFNGNAAHDISIKIRQGEIPPPIPDGFTEFNIALGGVCHTDGQILHLDFNGSSVVVDPNSNHSADVWVKERYDPRSKIFAQIISQAFSAALRRCGLFELPSAGVVPPDQDKATLIAGWSGVGKTTMTLQLAKGGWRYLSDDTLLLDREEHGITVYALRRFFALTAETIDTLKLTGLTARAGEPFKERVTPQDLFPRGLILRSRPGAIFFPVLTHEVESRLQRLTPAEAMTRLLRLCPWAGYDQLTAGKHLALLGDLARECVAFEFLAGTDVIKDQNRAASLLAEYAET